MTLEEHKLENQRFEEWYVRNPLDVPQAPIGSRECTLQRRAWLAAKGFDREVVGAQPTADAVQSDVASA